MKYRADDDFYLFPKELLNNEKYYNLSSNSKILYAILLEKHYINNELGVKDGDNRTYVTLPNDSIRELLNVSSKNAIIKMKNELVKNDLLKQIRRGGGKSNKLYVRIL